jgi:hypothetical protein
VAFWVIVFLMAGGLTMRNLSTWPARMFYPGEESYEGSALVEITRLAQGTPIYAPPSEDGFAGATYGPLYYVVGSHLVDPGNPSYLYLRLLSAFAIVGCALGCGVLTFWLCGDFIASCLSPLIFLSYGIVTFHGISALSDDVALFLFFCGFLIAYRFRNSSKILIGAPFMALGFYYKPQYIAGPLAVLLFLFIEKRYRHLIQFAGLLAICGVGLLALFQWVVFPGQEFWRHLFLYQATLLNWHQFKIGLLVFVLMMAVPLLLITEFLRVHPDRLITCYVVCAALLALVTISKDSAFIQYFYECILAASIIIPAFFATRTPKRGFPIDMILLLAFTLFTGQWYTPPAPSRTAFVQDVAVHHFMRRNFPANARALGFRGGDLLQAGFDLPFSDLFQFELLARRGLVPEDYLISRIKSQWFTVILLDFDLDTEQDQTWLNYYLNEPTRRAIAENYLASSTMPAPIPERFWRRDQFYIYVPRANRHAVAPAGVPEKLR